MKVTKVITLASILCLSACVQIPQESVDLSTQVGKDIALSHNSHRETIKVLFSRIRSDANRFIDEVYAPYQIREAIKNDMQNANSENPADKSASLLIGIQQAFDRNASDAQRKAMLEGMEALISELHENIENKRLDLLSPINAQERNYLSLIDKNYSQVLSANAVITSYLSSAVKVTESQKQILKDAGLKKDLNEISGRKIAEVSDKISEIVGKAKRVDDTAQSVETSLKEIKNALNFTH